MPAPARIRTEPPTHMSSTDRPRTASPSQRTKVYFTVDTEVWPGDWTDVDRRFPEAFRRYVYGPTRRGDYGLPLTLRVLADYGLRGVFFTEPVFSARFGLAPLAEIVGMIRAAGQEVQLHVHAEWANEATEPGFPLRLTDKVQHLTYLDFESQRRLLAWGRDRLLAAGSNPITAFRAGSFACNRDTLRAVEALGIRVDTSYNHAFRGVTTGIWPEATAGRMPTLPFLIGGTLEIPVTVYRDRPFGLRPLQVTACSLRETIAVLERSHARGDGSVMMVSHNFEFLRRPAFDADVVTAERFFGLCRYLERHADRFETAGFLEDDPAPVEPWRAPVGGDTPGLALRYVEQLRRRLPVPPLSRHLP